jgi:hypothetical protein
MSRPGATILCDNRDSLLTIVDIQTRLTAVMPAKVLARLQRNTTLLIRTAALFDVPVFVSEQYPEGLGPTEPDLMRLLGDGSRRYAKTCFSLAGVPQFIADVNAAGRRQIILAGIEAHICILQTALDLRAADLNVFVVADAVCSRQRENYETALCRMRDAGVIICDTESVMFEWSRDAKHEKFKAMQALL